MNPARTPGISTAQLAAWVTDTCHHQGVPTVVRDPATLTTVATLLGRPTSGPSLTAATRARESVSAAT